MNVCKHLLLVAMFPAFLIAGEDIITVKTIDGRRLTMRRPEAGKETILFANGKKHIVKADGSCRPEIVRARSIVSSVVKKDPRREAFLRKIKAHHDARYQELHDRVMAGEELEGNELRFYEGYGRRLRHIKSKQIGEVQ